MIAVLFGLLILLAIAVAAACWRMHWRLTATFLVALLWALNAAVMFLGMGMLNGAKGVAHDACLYGEDAVGRLVNTTVTGSASEKVTAALQYYSGQANLVDSKVRRERGLAALTVRPGCRLPLASWPAGGPAACVPSLYVRARPPPPPAAG